MRVVVALGGNALLRRGQAPSAENQRRNARIAAKALAPITRDHDLVISHGNGPQVGFLALQSAAYQPQCAYPLDILDAETEGMIGYLIEQELLNHLPKERCCATLLTQILVDPDDPAFRHPSKPIGPFYDESEARKLARERGWSIAPDGAYYRRVVPSPRPMRILELGVIDLLLSQGVIVICAGGGGIPTVVRYDGSLNGVEAVIDKDLASSLLARELKAQAFVMLTDVDAVYRDWGTARARPIRELSPEQAADFSFDSGSMGPKVAAAIEFVEHTGGIAGIGALGDPLAILRGEAGTLIRCVQANQEAKRSAQMR
jgi:carbamate kinase